MTLYEFERKRLNRIRLQYKYRLAKQFNPKITLFKVYSSKLFQNQLTFSKSSL